MLLVFAPDIMELKSSKKMNFYLFVPQNIFSKILGMIKIFFGQMWDESFV